MSKKSSSYGWVVAICGIIINLALGALYAWSIFKTSLMCAIDETTKVCALDPAGHLMPGKYGFAMDKFQTALPYAVAIGMFALLMLIAGRLQDKFGPRFVATAGGILLGIGFFVASLAKPGPNAVMFMIVGFGVLGGAGIGLGYACALPPALKWFPPSKKGLISGLVVGGFGISAAIVYPLTKYLIEKGGSPNYAFKILAVLFAAMVIVAAQFMKNPPGDYVCAPAPQKPGKPAPAAAPKCDYAWNEMLSTPSFIITWLMFLFAAGAGLMVISFIGTLAKQSNLPQMILWCMTVLAVGNCAGRIICGVVSDKLGRTRTMLVVFLIQAVILAAFPRVLVASDAAFAFGAFMIGFGFGSCLSLFPSHTADYFGMKNLGMNYGIVFTAYGLGGVLMTLMAGKLNYATAFVVAAILCVVAALLTFVVKPPAEKKA
jgi:MFS transporter, OFA family, oxalate/formate antiporter